MTKKFSIFILYPLTFSLFTFSFLLFPFYFPPCYASDTTGSTEIRFLSGKKSQTDGIDERDLSGQYSYNKYAIGVTAEPQQNFRYKVKYTNYKKEFDGSRKNLDNITNIGEASFSMPIYKANKTSISLDTDYELRTKRYKNSPSLEYDENAFGAGFDIKYNDNYSLKLLGGIKDYDYVTASSSDQFKTYFKIEPETKFLKKDLTVSGYYRRDWVDETDNKKDYSEDCVLVRTILKLKKPMLNKINAYYSYGRNDTKDSGEDREDNLRFEYILWGITTYHELNNKIDTQVSYSQKHRKYFTSINSYDDWTIEDKTKIKLLEDKPFDLDLLLAYEHRETKFYENGNLSYRKNSGTCGLNILKRSDFSLKPSLNLTQYDYPVSTKKTETDYKFDVTAKKYIGSTDKALEAGYWYKWKDYKYQKDIEQWAVNLAFELKF